MNSEFTRASRAVWVAAISSILVAIVAFVINSFLVFSAIDGKRLIERVETEAGRELTGYELYSEYREVNAYYYPPRESRGDVLYWFNALSLPWIVVSIGCIVIFLCVTWRFPQVRTAGIGSLAIMISLLAVVIYHISVIGKIAWAVE